MATSVKKVSQVVERAGDLSDKGEPLASPKSPEIGLKAMETKEAVKPAPAPRSGSPSLWVEDPLARRGMSKKLRKRKGWHQTTCRGDQFDSFMDVGYRQIRKAVGDEEPGEESGEVIKTKESETVTNIAVEIPEDVYQAHLRAVAFKSHIRYSNDAEKTLSDHIRGINKDYGAKKEVLRVVTEGNEPAERLESRASRIQREGGPDAED